MLLLEAKVDISVAINRIKQFSRDHGGEYSPIIKALQDQQDNLVREAERLRAEMESKQGQAQLTIYE